MHRRLRRRAGPRGGFETVPPGASGCQTPRPRTDPPFRVYLGSGTILPPSRSGPLPPFRVSLLLLLVPLAAPEAVEAQRICPEGEITRIVVRNHSVFPPEELTEAGRLRWAYDLTNAVRIRTRERFIRDELLFREGDCYQESLAREAARILREFRFMARAEVTGTPRDDEGVEVAVETRDEWSTKLSLALRFEDGVHFDGASMVEENFLGRGVTLELFRVSREAEEATGIRTEIPGIRGSQWDLITGGHRGRIGSGAELRVIHPFRGEVGRTAVRGLARRSRSLFPYDVPEDPNGGDDAPSHLVVPLITERAEISTARRWGSPGELLILGGGLSFERVAPGTVDEVEGVRESDFGDRFPASEEMATLLAPQLGSRRAIRLNVMAGVRHISFRSRYGLDTLNGIQDVPVGWEVLLSTGRSVGSTGPGRPADVFAGLDLRLGVVGQRHVAYLTGRLEGRREDVSGSVAGQWGDLLTEIHGFLYRQPGTAFSRTILLRGTVQGGWDTSSPFQLTLGGPAGIRGYREFELPVARKVVLTLENRGSFPGPFPGLVDLGFTLFGDVGAGWSGGVPLALDTGWRGTVGAGLRVSFPAGSSRVIRADLAMPTGPGALSRSPVFRISAREWVGILDDFRSPDLTRSRRSGISPDYIGASRDRSVP